MSPQIEETTVPASADCGVRTFHVRHLGVDGQPLTAIDISVCKMEDRGADGDAWELVTILDQVPNNADVGMALINLGTALLNHVGNQLTNPND